MRKYLTPLIAIFLVLTGTLAALNSLFWTISQKPPKKDLSFETISKSFGGAHQEKKNYLIYDKGDWDEVWMKLHGQDQIPPAPEVDFNDEMVIATFQGQQGSAGYDIEIEKVVVKNDQIEVLGKEIEPGKDCITAAVVTHPYHIIKLKKLAKNVIFNFKKEVISCESSAN